MCVYVKDKNICSNISLYLPGGAERDKDQVHTDELHLYRIDEISHMDDN